MMSKMQIVGGTVLRQGYDENDIIYQDIKFYFEGSNIRVQSDLLWKIGIDKLSDLIGDVPLVDGTVKIEIPPYMTETGEQ
jgi:hypothetical protein